MKIFRNVYLRIQFLLGQTWAPVGKIQYQTTLILWSKEHEKKTFSEKEGGGNQKNAVFPLYFWTKKH